MTVEMLLIAAARLAGSLPVLRWPFYGAVLAILVDLSDLFMMNLLHLGGVRDYQAFDKYLDQAYMLAFLAVALRWSNPERGVALALYAQRLAGFLAFEASGQRWLLLLFPNLFEPWYLLCAARFQFSLDSRLRTAGVAALGALLFVTKLFQEYAIHYARWLDGFTAVEAVEAAWRWLGPF
jgi:hypothetical protein